MTTEQKVKKCAGECGKVKVIKEFRLQPGENGRRYSKCKDCVSKMNAESTRKRNKHRENAHEFWNINEDGIYC